MVKKEEEKIVIFFLDFKWNHCKRNYIIAFIDFQLNSWIHHYLRFVGLIFGIFETLTEDIYFVCFASFACNSHCRDTF